MTVLHIVSFLQLFYGGSVLTFYFYPSLQYLELRYKSSAPRKLASFMSVILYVSPDINVPTYM